MPVEEVNKVQSDGRLQLGDLGEKYEGQYMAIYEGDGGKIICEPVEVGDE